MDMVDVLAKIWPMFVGLVAGIKLGESEDDK